MNRNSYKHLKTVLFTVISRLADVRSIFCVDPDIDFTKSRKLDFQYIQNEILDQMIELYVARVMMNSNILSEMLNSLQEIIDKKEKNE